MRSVLFLSALAYGGIAAAQAGSLDNTFDGDGLVTAPSGTGFYSVAIQSDGKIVAAGQHAAGAGSDFAVVRYHTDGTPDMSFGGGGMTTLSASTYDYGGAVAIQSDGRIVVAGYCGSGGYHDIAVVRFNSDGSTDNTFSGDGKVTTSIGSMDDEASGVAIQSDGKIVVVGETDTGSFNDFAVVRYNSDGSLDATFDGDGKLTTAVGLSSDRASAVGIQSDGRILIVGSSATGCGDEDFALVRLNTDGSLDPTFSSDGMVMTGFGSCVSNFVYAMAIQSDGRIVVAGKSEGAFTYDMAVARYHSDGTLDNGFDGDGKLSTSFGANDVANAVAVQSDGKIVVVGDSSSVTESDFALARYHTDGSLDTTFGGDGRVSTNVWSLDYGRSVALQSDGRIVVAGGVRLVRYNQGLTTGIPSVPDHGPISISPNPVGADHATIHGLPEGPSLLTISDVTGRVLHSSMVNAVDGRALVPTTRLPRGTYVVTVDDRWRSKMVKD